MLRIQGDAQLLRALLLHTNEQLSTAVAFLAIGGLLAFGPLGLLAGGTGA